MPTQQAFKMQLKWEANHGGTTSPEGYSKNYILIGEENKPIILGSAASGFRGEHIRYNPEELLIAAMVSCHMLWFLYLAKMAKVQVIDYKDNPEGILELEGSYGRFKEITLKPEIKVQGEMDPEVVKALQEKAHQKCYIANSVNFPVKLEPKVVFA